MENPSTWNLLIASLNTAKVENDPGIAWSFLVMQGIVSSSTDSYKSFITLTQELNTARHRQGPMPGPTFGAELAPRLSALTLPPGRQPDPFGRIAKKRWELASAWRKAPAK